MVDLVEAMKEAITEQRAMIEGAGIRVRAIDATRSPRVGVEPGPLRAALFEIVANALDRVPQGGNLELRLRELHGCVRVDLTPSTGAPGGVTYAECGSASALIAKLGGELWEQRVPECGIGFTLPRAGGAPSCCIREVVPAPQARRAERPIVRAGPAAA